MDKPKPPTEVDSCDEIRKAMIEKRNKCFDDWPGAIGDTVLFSHVIAWLGYCESLHQYVYQNDK